METFWATLKREIAHVRGASGIWFETRHAARAYLFEFIEIFYNRQRHQAGLGHLTPAEYAARSVNVHKPVFTIRGQLRFRGTRGPGRTRGHHLTRPEHSGQPTTAGSTNWRRPTSQAKAGRGLGGPGHAMDLEGR